MKIFRRIGKLVLVHTAINCTFNLRLLFILFYYSKTVLVGLILSIVNWVKRILFSFNQKGSPLPEKNQSETFALAGNSFHVNTSSFMVQLDDLDSILTRYAIKFLLKKLKLDLKWNLIK